MPPPRLTIPDHFIPSMTYQVFARDGDDPVQTLAHSTTYSAAFDAAETAARAGKAIRIHMVLHNPAYGGTYTAFDITPNFFGERMGGRNPHTPRTLVDLANAVSGT